MKDKTNLKLFKAFGIVLVLGMVLFTAYIMLEEASQGTPTSTFVVALLPAVAIIALMFFMVRQKSRDVKRGLPMHDEMSLRIKHRAGYYSYLLGIYFLLALIWYDFLGEGCTLPEIPGNIVVIMTMIFMFAVFGVSYLIIERNGIR